MRVKNFVIFITIFALMITAAGCGHLETYGASISNRNITPLGEILAHPKDYDGKTVTVKGRITIECETGCWLNLKDGNAVIYTDLAPSGFAIPQKVNRNATVEGKVSIENGKLILTGKGVEIR